MGWSLADVHLTTQNIPKGRGEKAMTVTVTLDRFLAGLPELVSGIDNVVIATYNNLDSHKNGGEFSANGRKVSILCGGADYANVETLVGDIPNEGAQATKTAGARKVSDGLTQVPSDSLVVLYAGKSRFNEMVQLSRRLAKRGTKVVLVSCGCDSDVFDGIESSENILLVVPTHGHCNGGRGDLSRVVAQLLN